MPAYIFYDFETSSRDLLGQIMAYSFIVTDGHLEPMDELNGLIRLNRTQLPDVEAILTNQINVTELQQQGDVEYVAAHKMYRFIEKQLQTHQIIILSGYNANSFDLNFFRNMLIRYGINPYFDGKIIYRDILHYVMSLAFTFPEKFKWTPASSEQGWRFYSFRLEDVAKAAGLLNKAQSHHAREDVLLTIELVKWLEREFRTSLMEFRPVEFPIIGFQNPAQKLIKQKVRHFAEGSEQQLMKYTFNWWYLLFSSSKDKLILDLEQYEKVSSEKHPAEEAILGCIRYINPNKHFFVGEGLSAGEEERWQPVIEKIQHDLFLKTLTREKYFEKTKKDWDIEYQIHELGFERIDELKKLTDALLSEPESYSDTVRMLWENRREKKDMYLIQLYNRLYLNYHPRVDPAHLHKYIVPRYITGDLVKNKEDFSSYQDSREKISTMLSSAQDTSLQTVLHALNNYYADFSRKNYFDKLN